MTKSAAIDWAPGMLAVVPFVDSESGQKTRWFAKLLSVTDVEAQLMELVPVVGTDSTYRANIASVWREPMTALKPCDAEYDAMSNTYQLRTPSADIIGLLQ